MGFKSYIRETRDELKQAKWPTRRQTLEFTAIVIGLSLLVAVFLGVFDFIFTLIIEKIIT